MSRRSSARSSSPAPRRSTSTSRRPATACSRWTRCDRATSASGSRRMPATSRTTSSTCRSRRSTSTSATATRSRWCGARTRSRARPQVGCRPPPGADPRDRGPRAVPRLRADGVSRERLSRSDCCRDRGFALSGSAGRYDRLLVRGGASRWHEDLRASRCCTSTCACCESFDALRTVPHAHRDRGCRGRAAARARTGSSPNSSARDCSSGCRIARTGSACGCGSSPAARPARSASASSPGRGSGAVHERVRQHTQLGVLSGRRRAVHRADVDPRRRRQRDAHRRPHPAAASARAGSSLLAHADSALVNEVIAHGLAGVHASARSARAMSCARSCATCATTGSP